MKPIYFNNSSTTQMSKKTLGIIKKELDTYFNPSDLYDESEDLMKKISESKIKISKLINCNPQEIYFTSCGSEGDTWIIKTIAEIAYNKSLMSIIDYNSSKPKPKKSPIIKNHIITTSIEHKAVLNTCEDLEKSGYMITYIKPDKTGHINPKDIESAINEHTIMVSVMSVNNILGTVQPIEEIGSICEKHGVLFHTDAVQALGNIPIDVSKIKCQAATFSAHKIHGPKAGFVYISDSLRNDNKIKSLIHGGGQEDQMRAGTQNVPYIVGIGNAVDELGNIEDLENRQNKIGILSCYLRKQLDTLIPDGRDFMIYTIPNYNNRINNNIHICFKNMSSDVIVRELSNRGVYVSSGSACNSGDASPDYVLKEIGIPDEYIYGGIRLTINEFNTIKECDKFIKIFKETLAFLDII